MCFQHNKQLLLYLIIRLIPYSAQDRENNLFVRFLQTYICSGKTIYVFDNKIFF